MKHTLPVFTATFALTAWIQVTYSVFSLRYAVPIGSIILFLFAFIYVLPKYRRPGAVLLGLFCGFLFTACYYQVIVRPVSAVNEKVFTITGTVKAYPQIYENEQRVTLSIPASQLGLAGRGGAIKTMAYLPLTEQDILPGDRVTASLSFYEPALSDGFSRKEYYAANGIYTLASCSKDDDGNAKAFALLKAERTPLWAYPLHLAEKMREGISHALPEREAAFLAGVLLGDTSEMQQSDFQALRKAGLSHVTAVSGMHMGFLVGFFILVFGKKYGSALSLLAILCFIPMAGASPSVIRAGIMYAMTCVAYLISRQSSSLHALCIAFLALVLTNPFAISGAGFQLSFAASLVLILCSTPLQQKLTAPFQKKNRIPKRIAAIFAGSISCSLGAMLFTAPILLVRFGYVSALSILANLLVVSVIGFIFVCGLLVSIVSIKFPGLAASLGIVLRVPIAYVLWAAQGISSYSYGMICWDSLWGKIAVILVYAFIALLYLLRGRKLARILVPLCLILFVGSAAMTAFEEGDTVKASFLPSGSGQTVLITAGRAQTVLIDCAASGYRNAAETVQEQLEWYGRDGIDVLILTAVDQTHAKHVPDLLRNTAVGSIIMPEMLRETDLLAEIMRIAHEKGVPVRTTADERETVLSGLPVSIAIMDEVERKLAVSIVFGDENILLAHSLTQKMLAELLAVQSGLTCTALVLSESNIGDGQMLEAALEKLTPETIILSAGYTLQETLFRRYPVRNTNIYGEIVIKTRLSSS